MVDLTAVLLADPRAALSAVQLGWPDRLIQTAAERLNTGLTSRLSLTADLWVELMVGYWVGQWAALTVGGRWVVTMADLLVEQRADRLGWLPTVDPEGWPLMVGHDG